MTMLETCSVRDLVSEDLPMVLAWRNHPETRRFMFTQRETSIEEHRYLFARVNQDSTQQLLIVEDVQEPIGFVHFSHVCPGGIAEWGFYVRPGAAKGSGRREVRSYLQVYDTTEPDPQEKGHSPSAVMRTF